MLIRVNEKRKLKPIFKFSTKIQYKFSALPCRFNKNSVNFYSRNFPQFLVSSLKLFSKIMTERRPVNLPSPGTGEDSIGVRLYNLITLLVDIVLLHIRFWFYTIEGFFYALCLPAQQDVKGEIVLITGAAHGIGREIASIYGRLGAVVVCWDINTKGNKETVEEIKNQGGKAYAYTCDVSKRDNILLVADKVKQEVGPVSILVNNAGIMPCHPLLDHSESEIRAIFDINVLAHLWLLQTFLPQMIEKNNGHIVALSSCAGLFGLKNLVPYCGSKFAVRGIMASLNEELRVDERNLQIKLTTIYPYMVDTGLCKRPHTRFPQLMKLVKPVEAATAIVDAQRRGIEEVTVPKHFMYLEKFARLFPRKAAIQINDFMDTGVKSDL